MIITLSCVFIAAAVSTAAAVVSDTSVRSHGVSETVLTVICGDCAVCGVGRVRGWAWTPSARRPPSATARPRPIVSRRAHRERLARCACSALELSRATVAFTLAYNSTEDSRSRSREIASPVRLHRVLSVFILHVYQLLTQRPPPRAHTMGHSQ
eukprot:7016936-Prymnesium_polylepis.2